MEKGDNQHDKAVKAYYIRGEFYDWVNQPKRFERIFHRFREEAFQRLWAEYGKGSVTLDVGCGTGLITRHLVAERVLGLDINRWNLERARTHDPKIEAIIADAAELPVKSGAIDVIVCTEVLEHLLKPQDAIGEFIRVLKPGGSIIGSVPGKSWIWRHRRMFLTTCPVSEPFHRNYAVDELKVLLQKQGLSIVTVFKAILGLTLFFVAEKPSGH